MHILFNFLKPLCYCFHFASREPETGKVNITGLDFQGRLPSASRCFKDLDGDRWRKDHSPLNLPASPALSPSPSVHLSQVILATRTAPEGYYCSLVTSTLLSQGCCPQKSDALERMSAQLGSHSSISGPHTVPIPAHDKPTTTNTLAKTSD